MADAPLVSVITPFLDEAAYLEDAIRSVVAQRHAAWELLLVDDGSTDASGEIARRWAASDPERIRHLTHPGGVNLGRNASRNLGLREARGELIAFLDADDVFLPFKLEHQVALLQGQPHAGLVFGRFLHWHSPSLPPDRIQPDFVSPLPAAPGTVLEPPDALRALLRDEDTHPANCAMLVRAALCREIGGFEDDLDLYEDTVFLAKAYLRTRVLVSGDCSAVYRLRPDSTCFRAEATGEYRPDGTSPARRAYLEWLERHLAEQGIADGELRAALRRELRPYRQPTRHALERAARRPLRRARRLALRR